VWQGGVIDGQGRFVYRNGDTYVGAFRNGKRHGRGELKATTGDGQPNRHPRRCDMTPAWH
jgi:hypothetical protein